VYTSSVFGGLLDPSGLIHSSGSWGVLIVCAIIFAETGLLVGFFFPGDTLLFFVGLLSFTGVVKFPLWVTILCVAAAATAGAQLGYLIGRVGGPPVFERRETGAFSRSSVERTRRFFDRFGAASVTFSRFVPVVRTFAPVAAGVAHMPRRRFFVFNVAGAVAWSIILIVLGFSLGHLPGVAGFVSHYMDLIMVAIVAVSVVPALARVIIAQVRSRRADPAPAAPERRVQEDL
jgi:membrane-associated protein